MELVVAQPGLDVAAQDSIKLAFAPLFDEAQAWSKRVDSLAVTDVKQVREMKLARESRLALKEIRCKAERKRKEMKEDVTRRGKAIDGAYNIVAYLTEPLEKRLLDMEQFAERKEQARLDERLVERKKALAYYGYTGLDDVNLRDLGEEPFDQILQGAKLLQEAKQKEAERAAQEKLAREQAEAAERERIRLENERLKAEAAAREEQMRKEREAAEKAAKEAAAKAEAEKKAALEAERKKRDEEMAKARAEQAARDEVARHERAKAEAAAKLEQERLVKIAADEKAARQRAEEVAARERAVQQARIDALNRQKAEAEAKAKAELEAAEEARRRAEFAPDREKLEAFLKQVQELSVPVLSSEIGHRATVDLVAMKKQFEKSCKHYISKL